MPKKLFYIFNLVAIMSLTVGCGSKPQSGVDSEGNVVLTFAGRSNENEQANYRTFISEFQAAHPNYTINIEWYENETAYNLALEGKLNRLPDIFMLSDDKFIPYAEGGFLADYKEFVDMDELKELVYDYGAEAYCYNPETDKYGWDESDSNCGFYAYPKDQGPYALMYNKTLFTSLMNRYNEGLAESEQLKLPSPTKPYTYDEFITVCNKLRDAEGSPNFYACAGYDFDSAIYSNNAHYFDETATTQKITEDNFVEAVEFFRDLYAFDCIAPYGGTTATGENAFLNGRCVFYYAGPWKCKDYWKQIESFEWDLIPVCVGPAEGAKSTAYVGSMGYVISDKSPVKKEAAVLAKYLATNESSQRSQYMRGQAIPNLRSMADEFINDELGLLGEKYPANRSVWIDVIDGCGQTKTDENGDQYIDIVTGKYRPGKFTYSSTWRTDLSNWLAGLGSNGKNVWKSEITPRAALEAYAETLQAYLDQMKVQSS
ncbi:MAG: extracellular solute-binding protein [Bacilli bacterium]|jgi:multiple sugar transport system substrate-binding protein|nr:extracellular solute-binding protein [Bacilli bacterium]